MKRQQDLSSEELFGCNVTHRVNRIYKDNVNVSEPIFEATDEEAINYAYTLNDPDLSVVTIEKYTGEGLKTIKEIKNEQRLTDNKSG